MPIYTYESLGIVGHIMVGKPTKLSTDTTAIEFIIAEPPWSTLYEKRCELEVYCRWHGLRVPKACSVELTWDEPANILARLEQENNQMQRRLDLLSCDFQICIFVDFYSVPNFIVILVNLMYAIFVVGIYCKAVW